MHNGAAVCVCSKQPLRAQLSVCAPSAFRRSSFCWPQVSSAFSQLLNLHNVTEESITARVEKAARLGEVEAATRSTNKSLQRLVNQLQVGGRWACRGPALPAFSLPASRLRARFLP